MWFWLAIIGGTIGSLKKLLNRFILRENGDSLAFAFFYQAIGAALAIPLFVFGLKFPTNIFPYLLLGIIGIVDTLPTFLTMESFKYLEVSLRTIVSQVSMFWVLIFSAMILGESLNFNKVIGVCLIFGGIAIAVFQKRRISRWQKIVGRVLARKDQRAKGIFATLMASFLFSLEMIGVKYLLTQFSVSLVVFAAYSISSLVFLLLRPEVKKRTLVLIKGPQAGAVWLTGILGSVSVLLGLWAVSITELSRANPILQSFTILTILGGVVFLKERERIWQKIFGGILAVIGVVLVKGS